MIFLYQAGRSKRGMKLLTLFTGDCPTMRLPDLESLGLPGPWTEALREHAHPDRMTMELWVETAPSLHHLQAQLRQRGYTRLPTITRPLVWLSSVPDGSDRPEPDRVFRGTHPVSLDPDLLKRWRVRAARS